MLTGSNIGLPNDLWVPSFGEIEPQRASQINLNLNYTPDSKFTFDCSFFGKYLDNLIRYPDESNLPSIADRFDEGWEEAVVVGNGISLGIEVDLVYKSEKVNMFLAYTLSKYDRQFDEINDGEAFPFIFDQNQNLSFDFNYKINPRLNLYLNWKYSRGIRQTLFETEFTYSPFENINPGEFGEIGDINADQLPDYHRLDVGGIITFGRRTKHQIVIGIQNLYNRKNIYYRYRMIPFMDENGNKLGSASIQNIEALPLIPTLRYSFEF